MSKYDMTPLRDHKLFITKSKGTEIQKCQSKKKSKLLLNVINDFKKTSKQTSKENNSGRKIRTIKVQRKICNMDEKHRKETEILKKSQTNVRNEKLIDQVTQWKASPIDQIKRRQDLREGQQG